MEHDDSLGESRGRLFYIAFLRLHAGMPKKSGSDRQTRTIRRGRQVQIGLSGMRYRARTRNTASNPQCSGSSRI